jgi:hypothetical protein
VGAFTAAKMMALNHAGESPSLACSHNMNNIFGLEHLIHQDLFAHLWRFLSFFGGVFRCALKAKFPENAAWRNTGFFEVPGPRLGNPRRAHKLYKSQLYGVIAIRILGFFLNHNAGTSLNSSNRNNVSRIIKNLRYSYLYSNQSINHNRSPFPVSRFPF